MILFDRHTRGSLCNIFGGIASIVNGIEGSSAATDAATGEENAAAQAGALAQSTATSADSNIANAANAAATGATTAATTGAAGVTGAQATGAGAVTGAAGTSNANLNPYAAAGATAATQLNDVAANGNQQPTLQQLQISPAYQFQLQQGEDALNRSAAAQGGAVSGGDVKSTENFAQGMAGTAYENAFNNFETAQQNNVQNLTGIANAGQNATISQNANTMNAAQYGATTGNTAATTDASLGVNAAQYGGSLTTNSQTNIGQNMIQANNTAGNDIMQSANARAAGILGKSSAIQGAVNGVASSLPGPLPANPFAAPAPTLASLPATQLPATGAANPFSSIYAGA